MTRGPGVLPRENAVVVVVVVYIILIHLDGCYNMYPNPTLKRYGTRYVMICIPIIYHIRIRVYIIHDATYYYIPHRPRPICIWDSVAANSRASLSLSNHPRQRHHTIYYYIIIWHTTWCLGFNRVHSVVAFFVRYCCCCNTSIQRPARVVHAYYCYCFSYDNVILIPRDSEQRISVL